MKIKKKLKYKKLLFLSFTFLLVFIFSFACLSVSALSSNGSTILGTSGTLWIFGTQSFYNAEVTNADDTIQYAYPQGAFASDLVATYSYFSFSGPSYGAISLRYYSTQGTIYYDDFNGLYDSGGHKIASFTVEGNNTYVLNYSGNMSSSFSVRAYFQHDRFAPNEFNYIADFSFGSDSPANAQKYNPPNTTKTDNYTNAENSVMNSTEQYRNESLTWFSRLGNLISLTSSLGKGMMSVTYIFERFMDMQWINAIVTYSFIIGLIAFIIGLGALIGSAHRHFKK